MNEKIIKNILLMFLLLLGIVVAVFKPPFVDQDYELYINLYYSALQAGLTDLNIFSYFRAVSIFSKSLGFDFNGVLLFYSGLSFFLKFYVYCKNDRMPAFALLIYFMTFFVLHEMTQIRVSLAVGVVYFFSYYSFSRNRKYIYYIGVLLSSLIHLSTLVFLLYPFFRQIIKLDSKLLFLIILSCYPMGYLISTNFSGQLLNLVLLYLPFDRTEIYVDLLNAGQHTHMNIFGALYFSYLSLTIFICIFKERILKIANEFEKFVLTTFYVGVVSFFYLSFLPVMAYRVSELLMSGMPLLLALFCYLLRPRIFGICLAIVYAFLIFSLNIFYSDLIKF